MTRRTSPFRFLLLPFINRSGAFGRAQGGAVMMEFALLATPFFFIIGAILETGLMFLGGQVLDAAVNDASRLIMTGQANKATDVSKFKTAICNRLYSLFDCSQLKVKVRTVSDFADAPEEVETPWDAEGEEDATWAGYEAGGRNQVVMVQVYYKWPLILNMPVLGLANGDDGTHLLASTRVFANEPF